MRYTSANTPAMGPGPATQIGSPRKPRTKEQAQVRIIILTLASFLLGVAVTAFWFHLVAKRNAGNSTSQTDTEPSAPQAAEPVVQANLPARPFVASHPPADAATIEEVKQAIPNFASISLADGTQLLREAALKRFAAAAKEMDAQIQQAQQQLSQAQNGQSVADQQTAMKHLQQTQTGQAEKLQQIAAQLQTQIAALKQLKGVAP